MSYKKESENNVKFSSKSGLSDALGMGSLLWLMGYVLSLVLFAIIPEKLMAQIILAIMTPVFFIIAFYKLRFKSEHISYYVLIGIVWLSVAVVLDYLFIIRLFNVKNYYDIEVIVYYLITVIIPILIGIRYRQKKHKELADKDYKL